jgi:hypothetical protein
MYFDQECTVKKNIRVDAKMNVKGEKAGTEWQ